MTRWFPVLLLVLVCLARFGSAQRLDRPDDLTELRAALQELKAEGKDIRERLQATEKELKAMRDVPKVAFAASLGGDGLQKTTSGMKNLVYREVLTNIGAAYNSETGVFTAPVRGVYCIRFTANAPSDYPMSAVLYKNSQQIQLIAHEQQSGEGSDTASNGAALQLQAGDQLAMKLWHETQIWDNSNHHSTFSGFLLFPL
ncbi:complement C1q-like protein 4 [Leuresthes tenuis]|uniref:complement C1q-like protein 4 n=1 Tax=Leuresthes tenuis TaxID=355514 RepID=UPI003B5149EC